MKEKDINIKLDPNLAISAALKSAVTASEFFFSPLSFDLKHFCKSRFYDRVTFFSIHTYMSNCEAFDVRQNLFH